MAQEPNLVELLRAATLAAERQERPGLAKAGPLDEYLCEGHAEFRDLLDELKRYGVNHTDFARHIVRNKTTVHDWYRWGFSERKPIPDYAFRAARAMLKLCRLQAVIGG